MILGMDKTDWVLLGALLLQTTIYMKKDDMKIKLFRNNDIVSPRVSDYQDIHAIMKKNNKNYLILYTTQTGTAEEYARKFAKEIVSRFAFNVMCVDVEEYESETLKSLENLPEDVAVSFFVSTYGEGQLPDGALAFEKFLSELDKDNLARLNFTLFGLGNSTYEFYNGASRKVLDCLKKTKATLIGKHGLADAGAGTTDEDYLAWKELTMKELKKRFYLEEQEQKFEPAFKLNEIATVSDVVSLGEPSPQYLPYNGIFDKLENMQARSFDSNNPYLAAIVRSHELFKSRDRSCIHSEFDISGSNIAYSTGDHLGIWPSNADEKVEKFLYAFNLNGETIFDLKPLEPTVKVPFPTPTTIGAAVRYYMEITGPISRQSFSILTQFAPNDKIKKRLYKLAADKNLFSDEITSKFFDLADSVLYLSGGAKWETVPWEVLIELLPHLQPRYYSISSSSVCEPNTIHITSVVESFPNPTRKGNVVGVATNLLKHIQVAQNNDATKDLEVHFNLNGPRNLFSGFKLPIHVHHSAFKLPTDSQTPVIMVGSGTGVAPFRGFIRERIGLVKARKDVKLGKHLLFYGSRDFDDFLYSDEWSGYRDRLGNSFEMVVAHSRIGPKKIYVQDRILEFEKEIVSLLNKNGILYVCGDAKGMAQGVHAVLVDILARAKSISKNEAIELARRLKSTGRYQEDVW